MRAPQSAAVALAGAILLAPAGSTQECHFEFADVSSSGAHANQSGRAPQVSGDGRFVAFESNAWNLVVGDTNPFTDVFVRDLLAQTTERVSVGPNGEQADAGGQLGGISYDGRYVAFTTASGLAPLDQNGLVDVYVRDRVAGTTEWISEPMLTTGVTKPSVESTISADGRFVAFVSAGTNFVPGDPADWGDVFLRDRLLDTTILISQSTGGAWGDRGSGGPKVSANGSKVVFFSNSSTFDPAVASIFTSHLYLRDVALGTTALIDKNSTTGEPGNDNAGGPPGMTPDGSGIAFTSGSTNLFPGQMEYEDGPILWTEPGTLVLVPSAREVFGVNWGSSFPALSVDGRYVSFASTSPEWVIGLPTGGFRTYVTDLMTGATAVTSAAGPANLNDWAVQQNSMSWDGSTIAFAGQAENLVPGTGDLWFDRVFVRVCDLTAGLNYCYPMKSPVGCLPHLAVIGAPSSSQGSGHTLRVTDAVNDQVGLVVYGTSTPKPLAWNGSYLCVAPQVRLATKPTGGTPPPAIDCTGTFELDFNAWIASGGDANLLAGTPVYAQAWVRDPSHPAGALLSDAAAFVIGP